MLELSTSTVQLLWIILQKHIFSQKNWSAWRISLFEHPWILLNRDISLAISLISDASRCFCSLIPLSVSSVQTLLIVPVVCLVFLTHSSKALLLSAAFRREHRDHLLSTVCSFQPVTVWYLLFLLLCTCPVTLCNSSFIPASSALVSEAWYLSNQYGWQALWDIAELKIGLFSFLFIIPSLPALSNSLTALRKLEWDSTILFSAKKQAQKPRAFNCASLSSFFISVIHLTRNFTPFCFFQNLSKWCAIILTLVHIDLNTTINTFQNPNSW